MSQTNEKATEIKVMLLKPHTHAGKKYETDTVLTVSQATADWLIKNGVAEPAKSEQADDKANDKAEPAKPKAKPNDKEQE